MATDMTDRAPEGLRELYAEDLGPVSFTVDDIVAAGRRRQRRQALVTVAGAVAAVAVVGVAAAGLLGGEPAADRLPVGPAVITPPDVTTPQHVTYPGCADRPATCAAVVAQWSRGVTGSTAPVERLSDKGFEKGSVVLVQRVTVSATKQDVDLKVVISPSTTAPDSEAAINLVRNATVLPGIPVVANRRVLSSEGSTRERLSVQRGDFVRAVSAQVSTTNHGDPAGPFSRTSTTIEPPSWWSTTTVADLVSRLYGTEAVLGASTPSAGTSTR